MNIIGTTVLDWKDGIPENNAEFTIVVGYYKEKYLMILNNENNRGWEFPGGKVEKNEKCIEAAKREFLEETGLEAHFLYYIGTYVNKYLYSDGTNLVHLYTFNTDNEFKKDNQGLKVFDSLPEGTTLGKELNKKVISNSKQINEGDLDSKNCWNNISPYYESDNSFSFSDFHYGPFILGDKELMLLPNIDGKKVLDVGCGLGHNSIYLNKIGGNVYGLDVSKEQLSRARLNTIAEGCEDINIIQGDINEINVKHYGTFDIIVSVFALQFIKDIDHFFEKLNKLLKNEGEIIISFKNPNVYLDSIKEMSNQYGPLQVGNDWFQPGMEKSYKFVTYYNSVKGVIYYLEKNGFIVEKLIEPEPELINIGNLPYTNSYYNKKLSKNNDKYTLIIKAKKNVK